MDKFVEAQIFPNVSKSFEDLKAAMRIFENILEERVAFDLTEYYRARNFMKSAESLYQEALTNARKLLGPLPEYASEDFIAWRAEILEKRDILAKSKDIDALKAELLADDKVSQWLTGDEIVLYLEKYFESQRQGHRELVNIKARIVLVKLQESILQAKDLQKKAFEKQQPNP